MCDEMDFFEDGSSDELFGDFEENELEAAGLDRNELIGMDDDERYERLAEAGLDPDMYMF